MDLIYVSDLIENYCKALAGCCHIRKIKLVGFLGMISSTENILFTVVDRWVLELHIDVISIVFQSHQTLTITLSGASGSLAGNQRTPYQWEVLWIKQDLCAEPWMVTWRPIGILPESESWSLYLSILYPIRLSPSITPSTERMGTAFTKPHPLFTSPPLPTHSGSLFNPSVFSNFHYC